MLRSEDHGEEAGYEQEEQSSQQREDALAASASIRSMDGSFDAEGSSKAKVWPELVSMCACRAPSGGHIVWVRPMLPVVLRTGPVQGAI